MRTPQPPQFIEVDAQVIFTVKCGIPANATDAELTNALLTQFTVSTFFADKVKSIQVRRSPVVGIAQGPRPT